MSASAIVTAVSRAFRRSPAAESGLGMLTRRASLNAVASLIDYVAKIVVGLVVTPILVSGLGNTLFGVWEMLGRISNYMTAADGRPSEALRLVIAQHQGHPDDALKRRNVGAALVVWLLVLPLVLAIAALFIWLAPSLTQTLPQLHDEVRLTCALLALALLLGTLTAVPESVLRGMNLGYKRMGVQAGLNLLNGLLMAVAVWAGLGLAGLGGAVAIGAAATAFCFWVLVRSYVSWFGAARPTKPEVKALFGMSLWLTAGNVVSKLVFASDVVILGAVLAPAVVTTYVLTGYAARVAVGTHVYAASAAIPGLGGLLGLEQFDRAARARGELVTLTWLFVTIAGSTILLWNRSFLSLWVGAEHYAGAAVDLMIVLVAVQTAFIRVDSYVIDAALKPRLRVLVSVAAGVVTLALCIVLSRAYGIVGLCAGLLAGRTLQSVAYPIAVRSSLGRATRPTVTPVGAVRLAVVTALLFGGAAWVSQRVLATSWLLWGSGVVATAVAAAGLALALGPSAETRKALLRRLLAVFQGGRER